MQSSTQNPNQNFPDNVLYEMDNLDVLRGMNSETVDLIATDPPFNTKRNRAGSAGFYVDNWKWGDTGKLPDQWAWNEVHPIWLDQIRDDNRALFEVIEATGHCHGQNIAAFLCFLSVRLLEMHRVLKPTGSLYLHCDHTANAYIRMALDAIFGAKNFRSEIAWKRSSAHNDTKQGSHQHGRIHDNLLFYTKSNKWTWNPIYTQYDQDYVDNFYRHADLITGRKYRTGDLTAAKPGGDTSYEWRIKRPVNGGWESDLTDEYEDPKHGWEYQGVRPYQNRYWAYSRENMTDMSLKGRLVYASTGQPNYKRYLDEMPGVQLQDLWTDIKAIQSKATERTGSPDQKPLALYERIVLASSNPEDLILDPFAGCATTIMAAQNNGRRWVGIDRRPDARHHVVCRILGIKAEDAQKLAKSPTYGDWIIARLAELETNYKTIAPIRTDTGENAAPFLPPVYTINERSALTHKEMKEFLIKTFGLQCWGCNFKIDDERYFQLDHVEPKADGGSNHLDNRALLCQPCNQVKSNRITISQLRRENIKSGYLTRPSGTPRGQDGHPIKLPDARAQCREALERHRRGQPLQLGMIV